MRLQGKQKEADALYNARIDDVIEPLKSGVSQNTYDLEQLATAFLNRDQYAFAQRAYLDARAALNIPIAFYGELVDVYLNTNKHEALIDECLMVLFYEPQNIKFVQDRLVTLVDANVKMDYLQEGVARRLQKHPEKVVYENLLLWVFVQQKKFRSAMRQATAMDKRNRTEGENLINLAQTCLSNKEYGIATRCYDKVVETWPEGYYYLNAKLGSLETAYKEVVETNVYTDSSLSSLVHRFTDMLSVYGKSNQTAKTIKQLADIYIFYTHDVSKGQALLEELVKMPGIPSHDQARYKLALGDVYVMLDEVWDASLLYGQVDKVFKEEPLGQEAKFRNARLSYFRGDFDWAKSQLDVLKTATSQLIANNALELSLLIQDNTGMDSTTDAMADFANAQFLLFQNKLEASLNILNMMAFRYPKHALEDEVYFTKARIYTLQKEYIKAEEYYNNVVQYFGGDILADNALYALGELYQYQLNQPQKAIEAYEQIIFKYNDSLFVVEARKRYNLLKAKYPADSSEKS